jgi:hypothetical protein
VASSIPSVSVEIFTGLSALAVPSGTLEGATVFYSLVAGEDPSFDQIVVGDERDIDRPVNYTGGQQQQEEYVVPIQLASKAASHDLVAAKTRLMALVSAVERWHRDNRQPGTTFGTQIDGLADVETQVLGEDLVAVTTEIRLRVHAVVTL